LILIECNPDAFVLKQLGFSGKRIKHEGGKGKVYEIVGKTSSSIGMVDEDPDSGQPADLRFYQKKDQFGSLVLMVNKMDDSKQIIQVSPYLEHWLVERAKKNGMSLGDFGLPSDSKALHDIPHLQDNPEFQRFIRELVGKDEEMNRVRDWIKGVE
jgi:hypothetical protein